MQNRKFRSKQNVVNVDKKFKLIKKLICFEGSDPLVAPKQILAAQKSYSVLLKPAHSNVE